MLTYHIIRSGYLLFVISTAVCRGPWRTCAKPGQVSPVLPLSQKNHLLVECARPCYVKKIIFALCYEGAFQGQEQSVASQVLLGALPYVFSSLLFSLVGLGWWRILKQAETLSTGSHVMKNKAKVLLGANLEHRVDVRSVYNLLTDY